MDLFNQTMKVHKQMTCECCSQELPIWKLQRSKMKKISLHMEKLLSRLENFYKNNKKVRKYDKAFVLKRDEPDFFSKQDQDQINELVHSLFYYSDRWSYSRYTRVKGLWKQYKAIQAKYQKTWDSNKKARRTSN